MELLAPHYTLDEDHTVIGDKKVFDTLSTIAFTVSRLF